MACVTHGWLQANCPICPGFIEKNEWPPNFPDLNPLYYCVYGAKLEKHRKLEPKLKTINELKVSLHSADYIERAAATRTHQHGCGELHQALDCLRGQ